MANLVVTNTKKWWQSKTIWVNLVAGILGLLGVVDGNFLSAIGITNTAHYLILLGGVNTALNMFLRVLGTNMPISSQNQNTIGIIDKTGDDGSTVNQVDNIITTPPPTSVQDNQNNDTDGSNK